MTTYSFEELTKVSGIPAASIFRVKYGSYRILLNVDKYLA
jgi:mRNA-degrading endonuclease RelE of RelBE toxin-antitoxin system